MLHMESACISITLLQDWSNEFCFQKNWSEKTWELHIFERNAGGEKRWILLRTSVKIHFPHFCVFDLFIEVLSGIRSFSLVKKENGTCELALCVTGFSFHLLCVCVANVRRRALLLVLLCNHGTLHVMKVTELLHIQQHEKKEAEQNRRSRAKPANPPKNLSWCGEGGAY